MGQIGELVGRLDDLRRAGKGRIHIAVIARPQRRRAGSQLAIVRQQLRRAALLRLAVVPFDGDEVAGLQCAPHAARPPRRRRGRSATTSHDALHAFAAWRRTTSTVAPNSGGWIMTAVSMSGSFTSMVKCCLPVVFGGSQSAAASHCRSASSLRGTSAAPRPAPAVAAALAASRRSWPCLPEAWASDALGGHDLGRRHVPFLRRGVDQHGRGVAPALR